MTDDPVAARLRALLDKPHDPDPRFMDGLHDVLASELGLSARRTSAPGSLPATESRTGSSQTRLHGRWSSRTLLAAALLAAGVTGATLAGAGLVSPAPSDLLATVQQAGAIRIQVAAAPAVSGLNTEVARRLGERIGIPVVIVEADSPNGLADPEAWDLAIPGTTAAVDRELYVRSKALYAWPGYVATRTAKHLSELAGKPICTVDGTVGALWVEHPEQVESLTPMLTPPADMSPTVQPSQRACRDGLSGPAWGFSEGDPSPLYPAVEGWDAMVSSDSQGSLIGLGGLVAVDDSGTPARTQGFRGQPAFTVGVPIVAQRRGPDPSSLLALVDRAIGGMHEDGTIAALSIEHVGLDVTDALTADSSPTPDLSPVGWTYLALGDSNVYGPAEACDSCTSYPHLLSDRIRAELGIPVRLIDGSQWNGLTSSRLLGEITSDSWGESWELPRDPTISPREAIAAADLVTITVAANDQPWFQDPDPCGGDYDETCIDRVVGAYRQNLEGILREISSIRAGRPTAILVTTIYDDTLAGPGYDPTWFYTPDFLAASAESVRTLIDALNGAITEVAEANGASVVDMHAVAHGADGTMAIPAGWFSAEFGDLNQKGQDAFAEEMMRVGFAPLVRALSIGADGRDDEDARLR